MSSRVAVAPFQGATSASGRQAKKVNVPVVPNMTMMDRSKCRTKAILWLHVLNGSRPCGFTDEDVNRNVRSNLSCRSMASPSQMSDDRSSSDSQNCNRLANDFCRYFVAFIPYRSVFRSRLMVGGEWGGRVGLRRDGCLNVYRAVAASQTVASLWRAGCPPSSEGDGIFMAA